MKPLYFLLEWKIMTEEEAKKLNEFLNNVNTIPIKPHAYSIQKQSGAVK